MRAIYTIIIGLIGSKRQLLLRVCACWLGILSLSSCAYRFTNLHVQLPNNIRKLAVEAVYDTSREVIPHEELWGALQRAFAADGHLRVVSQGSADAILRAHITQVTDNPTGTGESKGDDEDRDTNNPAALPKDYRILPQAGEFTTRQTIRINVAVEIIDLYSRAVIFSRVYNEAENYRSFRSESGMAQQKSQFLFYEEARRAKIKLISENIAKSVVRDFLVGT